MTIFHFFLAIYKKFTYTFYNTQKINIYERYKRTMNRKIILLLSSCILLLFCSYFHHLSSVHPHILPESEHTFYDPFYSDILKSRDFSTLIVSILADEDDLYSEETGIISTHYLLRGRESEREIRLCVYDKDGTPLVSQGAGIRLSGATSRNALRKSFRIIAREEYDSVAPRFTYDFWDTRRTLDGSNHPIREYRSFVLHSMRYAMDATGIHNSVGYTLARQAGIKDASPTVPAAVYLNGVYQGAYFIMPAKNDHALCELYHIQDPKDIEIVTVFEQEKTGQQPNPEVLEKYLEFVHFVQTSDVNQPEVIAQIEKQLDVHQCLQYYAVNLLLANGDWMDNNLRVWRCKDNGLPYQDHRWRFFLYDLDWIGSFPDLVTLNFQQATMSNEYYNLLPSLLKNPKWLVEFKEILSTMQEDAFYAENIEAVFASEEAKMGLEASYDLESEAFYSYRLYSVNSKPLTDEDLLTLEDRAQMVEDFKSHMLQAPALINECIATYFP